MTIVQYTARVPARHNPPPTQTTHKHYIYTKWADRQTRIDYWSIAIYYSIILFTAPSSAEGHAEHTI